MIDNNLTTLIGNIEENLISQCLAINEYLRAKPSMIQQLVLTDTDKDYPSTATIEDILNDPENIVIDIEPKYMPPIKNMACLLSKERQDDLLLNMQTGINTIKAIKNNLASLSYTDKQISIDIVKNELTNKVPMLEALKYSLEINIIVNDSIKKGCDEVLGQLNSLLNRIKIIKDMETKPNPSIDEQPETDEQSQTNTNKVNTSKPQLTPFIDYLHHDNKPALMEKLHELLDGRRGREVAKVLMALEDKHYLTIPTKELDNVRKSMILVFGGIGTKQSVNNYYRKKDPNGNYIIPQNEIQQIMDILP